MRRTIRIVPRLITSPYVLRLAHRPVCSVSGLEARELVHGVAIEGCFPPYPPANRQVAVSAGISPSKTTISDRTRPHCSEQHKAPYRSQRPPKAASGMSFSERLRVGRFANGQGPDRDIRDMPAKTLCCYRLFDGAFRDRPQF